MIAVQHLTMTELEASLDTIRQSPKDEGVLALIVRRPQTGEREVLAQGELDRVEGLVGDSWINAVARAWPMVRHTQTCNST